jgi:hypothetical protein
MHLERDVEGACARESMTKTRNRLSAGQCAFGFNPLAAPHLRRRICCVRRRRLWPTAGQHGPRPHCQPRPCSQLSPVCLRRLELRLRCSPRHYTAARARTTKSRPSSTSRHEFSLPSFAGATADDLLHRVGHHLGPFDPPARRRRAHRTGAMESWAGFATAVEKEASERTNERANKRQRQRKIARQRQTERDRVTETEKETER